tara:strand:+ start:264 stop:482 length:219 start_codon:yes stop_codon:yes gene_type:complete
MAKITINNTDYYTEDFNEEQNKIYNEVVYVKEQVDRYKYLTTILDARMTVLANMIVSVADSKEEEVSDTEET